MKDDYIDIALDLDTILAGGNLADEISEKELDNLGASIKAQVTLDDDSRSDWITRNDKWMELVTQVLDNKTYPWPGASNIKFPLIATAAVQFHARAHPALLGSAKPVKCKIIGRDPKSLKAERGSRVGTFMSYQVMEDIPEWQDEMDRLLFLVPIVGSLYKKTYYSPNKGKILSDLINPRDFIINYDAKDLETARKTHRLWKYPNQIKEMQLKGIYREWEDDGIFSTKRPDNKTADAIQGKRDPGPNDDYVLQEILEVHCLLDLDRDGYKEPYIVTIRGEDGMIYRIVPNFNETSIETLGDKIVGITPEEYFTHYYFLPDPESKTHGIGFGTMIGPINDAVNTLINQLSDAGHLSNLQAGFLSRGVRIKGGNIKFRPGEWKTINATGDDLRKGIYPLPTREPSQVLFELLGLLINSGKDLASVQDIMVGRNPGQNQPYRTSVEVIEQGMKVFNGIYKRLYRSMTSEFKKIYRLNRAYPDPFKYLAVLDLDGQEAGEATQAFGPDKVLEFLLADFDAEDIDIIPSAEPDMLHEMERSLKANALLEKLSAGLPLNVIEVTKRALEAEKHEDIESLMNVPPPQPSFDQQLKKEQLMLDAQTAALEGHLKRIKTEAEVLKMNTEAQLLIAQAANEKVDGLHAQFIKQQELQRKEFEAVTQRIQAIDAKKAEQSSQSASGNSS